MRKTKPLPSLDFLNSIFECSEFGILRHRKIKKGDIAGTLHPTGYIVVTIDGKKYGAHRIVYFMTTGHDPMGYEIDHVNEIKTDNSPSNLRKALSSENRMNKGPQSNNKSGIKGVHYSSRDKRWIGQVKANDKKYWKYCKTIEEAKAWVENTRNQFHGKFANNGTHQGESK